MSYRHNKSNGGLFKPGGRASRAMDGGKANNIRNRISRKLRPTRGHVLSTYCNNCAKGKHNECFHGSCGCGRCNRRYNKTGRDAKLSNGVNVVQTAHAAIVNNPNKELFKDERDWKEFRNDDHLIGYQKFVLLSHGAIEKYGLPSWLKDTPVVLQISKDKKYGTVDKWVGYYDENRSQRGYSLTPEKDMPYLNETFSQVRIS